MYFIRKLGKTSKFIIMGALLSYVLVAADNTIFSAIINMDLTGFDVIIGNVLPIVLHILLWLGVFGKLKEIWRPE